MDSWDPTGESSCQYQQATRWIVQCFSITTSSGSISGDVVAPAAPPPLPPAQPPAEQSPYHSSLFPIKPSAKSQVSHGAESLAGLDRSLGPGAQGSMVDRGR